MKKALTNPSTPRPARLRFTLPLRIAGGLTLLGLVAGLGLFASRPAHTAGGPIPVSVANTPLATSDVDNPEQQPFQYQLSPNSTTSNSATDSYTVPAGKRVVIEYYSAQLTQYPSGGYGYVYLITTANGQNVYYKIIPPVASTVPVNQLTRIYADPGTQITGYVIQSSGTSCGASVILSGHYVTAK